MLNADDAYQRGFIGLIGLLMVVLIIAVWFAAMGGKLFGTGSSKENPMTNSIVPTEAQKGAIDRARDARALIESRNLRSNP